MSKPKSIPSLVDRARNGDVDAFSELMEPLQARLMAQAVAFCHDEDLARDLVQETMIAAWKSLGRFDGSCQLFTWLYVILLRQHKRADRWFSRRIPLATLDQTEAAGSLLAADPESPGKDEDESRILREMVERLPTRQRDVVRLRYYGDAAEAEIAACLGISPGTVKSRLHHAMKKLRRMKENMNQLNQPGHS